MNPVLYFHKETNKNKPTKSSEMNQIIIKKKSQRYENEVLKCEQSVRHFPNEFGDRFISRRYTNRLNPYESSFNLTRSDDQIDLFKLKETKGYWRLHSHGHNMRACVGLDVQQNVLNLHDWTTGMLCRRALSKSLAIDCVLAPNRNVANLDWACKPRTAPLAYNDSTHDLPEFHRFSDQNIIAWSKCGKIAASFGRDLVLWSPPGSPCVQKKTTVYRVGLIRSLAFNHQGNLLALGVYRKFQPILQIYQIEDNDNSNDAESSLVYSKEGICEIGLHTFASDMELNCVRAIEWDPLERNILCGMLSGQLYMVQYPLGSPIPPYIPVPKVQMCKHHSQCIANIKYSMNRTFIATVDFGGNLSIRRRKQFDTIYYKMNDADLFAWHPWRSNDIFIAASLPGKISILELSTKTVLAFYQRHDKKCSIDAITVNPLSAELVVSVTREDDDGNLGCEILVLASMNRVVDNLTAHTRTVNFLLWNPNGTHIATAGNDETLNIWDFFGMSQRKVNELLGKTAPKRKYNSKLNLQNAFFNSR